MSENQISSLDHHPSIFCMIRTPFFIRILLILFYIIVSFVLLSYAIGNENTIGGPVVLLYSWFMYVSKLRDLAPNVIVPDFLEYGSVFILHFLYLAGLCVITTLSIQIIKSPMIRKYFSLLVPIAIHLSGPMLFLIMSGDFRSSFISKPLGSLIALSWVIFYRTLDWRLAQKARRKSN